MPNALFSSSVLLNVSRKGREWRFEELLVLSPPPRPAALVDALRDARALLKADPRVIRSLHRRAFLNALRPDGPELLISCYVEAANRDQYAAAREDLLLNLLQILASHGLRVAPQRRAVEVAERGGVGGVGGGAGGAAAAAAAPGAAARKPAPRAGGGGGAKPRPA